MTDIVMPKLSDSMEQGTIISWFKSTDDQVEAGEELLEIETDKSTAPYVAEVAGTLEILAPVGTTVAVGEPIGRIGSGVARQSTAEAPEAVPPRPVPVPTSNEPSAPEALTHIEEPTTAPHNGHGQVAGNLKATPLARRVAATHDVELEMVVGTGPLGRITRADVLVAAGIAPPVQRTMPTPAEPVVSQPAGSRRQELSRVQQLIASRMAEAKSTVPHFQVQTEADMAAALALREQLKAVARERQPVPSINDVIVKAAAIALR